MDFGWDERQIELRNRIVAFARDELNDDVIERDADSQFSLPKWKQCAAFGIQGFAVPPEYGGAPGMDFMSAILAMEGLGYGCRDNGLTFALNAVMWTVALPIVKFGSEAQKRRYLPPICAGELIGAHAITEPEAGSDIFAMATRAEKVAGGYRLNGRKHLVSLAPLAEMALVFATVDPSVGRWGITGFLVDRDSPGFAASESQKKMGLRTVPIGEIVLEDCFVPEANRLGPEGAGASLSTRSLEWERCCILASQIGAMERQLEECVAYAQSRKQFGRPIGKFQAVSHRIVDMRLRLETSRLLLYKVAWLKQHDLPAMAEAALLKLHLSESFVASSLDAIRIHGGRGYLSDTGIERDLRDAVGGTIYAGTSDIQRNIVAGMMGMT